MVSIFSGSICSQSHWLTGRMLQELSNSYMNRWARSGAGVGDETVAVVCARKGFYIRDYWADLEISARNWVHYVKGDCRCAESTIEGKLNYHLLPIKERGSLSPSLNLSALGASIYDVRTEGGRGVSPKEDVVREVA